MISQFNGTNSNSVNELSVAGSRIWNQLPTELKSENYTETYLFSAAYTYNNTIYNIITLSVTNANVDMGWGYL